MPDNNKVPKKPTALSYVTDVLACYLAGDLIGYFIGAGLIAGLIGAGVGALIAIFRYLHYNKKK